MLYQCIKCNINRFSTPLPHNNLCVSVSSCPAAAGEKAIVCDQCGAQFQTEESLEAHRQIHTGKTSRARTNTDKCIGELDFTVVDVLLNLC